MPLEIIEAIATQLTSETDYLNVALGNRQLFSVLMQPHSLKRFMLTRFDNDTGILLHYLIRNRKQAMAKAVLSALLAQPQWFTGMDVCDITQIMYQPQISELKLRILQTLVNANYHSAIARKALEAAIKGALWMNEVSFIRNMLESHLISVADIGDESNWHVNLMMNDQFDVLNLLLEQGKKVTANQVMGIEIATRKNNLAAVGSLLGVQPAPELIEAAWTTAAYEGRVEILEFLIHSYAVSPRFNHDVALKMACRKGYADVLKLLIRSGVQIATVQESEMYLYFATRYGLGEIVRVLVEAGVSPDSNNGTPLREAVQLGLGDIVKVLVEAGARVDRTNFDAVRMAKQTGQVEMYTYLLQKATEQFQQQEATEKTIQRRFINDTWWMSRIPGQSTREWL